VLIGLFDANDAHHDEAESLIRAHIGEAMTIGPVNHAEVLVRAAREGREDSMVADIRSLGITVTALPDDAGPRLARLRASTGAKMPDCCVLLTAEQTNGIVATFDDRLRKIADGLGHRILPAERP
jgi:predicted nucleic acid-binding protein